MLVAKLLLAIASVAAIKITSPSDKDKVKAGEPVTITWDSVSTDPDSFTLAVQIPQPFSTKNIAENVETSAGSYSWTPDADLAGEDYRIHFLNEKDNGILAESGTFSVESGSATGSGSSTTTSGAASRSSASGQSTKAPTASNSGASASASKNPNASGSNAAGSESSGLAPPNTTQGSGAAALVPSLALVAAGVAAAVF